MQNPIHWLLPAISLPKLIVFGLFLWPSILSATIEIDTVKCICGSGAFGQIELIANGEAGPFTFDWSGPDGFTSIDQNLDSLTESGMYEVLVTNAYGCTTYLSTMVNDCDPLILEGQTTSICPTPTNSGIITLTVSGGAPPYSYQWSNEETSASLIGVAAGTYQVTVTDDNGCTIDGEFIIEELEAPMLSGQTTPTCENEASGNIQLTVSGGSPPYTYSWNTGYNMQNLENLVSADYQVTVTDVNGCTAVDVFTVGSMPVATLEASVQNTSCVSVFDGSIALTATGGTPPFTYSWSKESDPEFTGTTANISTLEVGTYCVTVSDANACQVEGCWEVGVNDEWPYVKQVDVFVQGASQDFPIYSARWEETAAGCIQYIKNEEVFIGTEALGEIMNGSNLIIDVITSVDMSAFNMSLPGTSIGVFSGPNSGGANWSFFTLDASEIVIDNVISQQLAFAGEDQSNPPKELLSLGNELEGCVELPTLLEDCSWNPEAITGTDLAHVLEMPCPLDVTIISQNQQTALEVQIVGETPPYSDYTFTWTSPEQPGFSATGYLIENLSGGEYCVTIQTPTGCSLEKCKSLCNDLDDFTIIATASCADLDNGSACIELNNGYALHDVQIDWIFDNGLSFENTACIEELPAGTYNVTLNLTYFGCDMISSIVVVDIPSNTGSISVEADYVAKDCPATQEGEGEICLSINGGVGPYSYNWSTGATTDCLNNAVADMAPAYSVTVTDLCGTEVILNNILPEQHPGIVLTNQTIQDAFCSSETGTFSAVISGGQPPYIYLINDASNNLADAGGTSDNISVNDLASGSYFITITDNNCAADFTGNFQVGETFGPASFAITNEEINHVCDDATLGSIDLTVGGEGESGPFTFSWSNGNMTANPTGLEAGSYAVTITNQFDCELTRNFEITRAILQPTFNFKVTETCKDYGNTAVGSIQMTFTDEENPNPPYLFNWSNGEQWTSSNSSYVNTLDNLTVGQYYVTITNASGCQYELPWPDYQVLSVPFIRPTFSIVDYSGDSGQADGFIAIGPISEGTPEYNITWYDEFTIYDPDLNFTVYNNGNEIDNNINLISGLTSGEYSVLVVDAKGCAAFENIELNNCPTPSDLTVNSNVNDVTHLTGGQQGSININVEGGAGPDYDFYWTGPAGFESTEEDINGLTEAGEYCVVVHDGNDCRDILCIDLLDDCPQLRLILKHANSCETNNQGVSGLFFEGIQIFDGGTTEEVFLEWYLGYDTSGPPDATGKVRVSSVGGNIYMIDEVLEPITQFILPNSSDVIKVIAYLDNGCSVTGQAEFSQNELFFQPLEFEDFDEVYSTETEALTIFPSLVDELRFHRTCGCLFDGIYHTCKSIEEDAFNERFWFEPYPEDQNGNPNASNVCQRGGILHIGNTFVIDDTKEIPPNNDGFYVQQGDECGCIFPVGIVSEYPELYHTPIDPGNNVWEVNPSDGYIYVDLCGPSDNTEVLINIGLGYSNRFHFNEFEPEPTECDDPDCGGCWGELIDPATCEYNIICLETGLPISGEPNPMFIHDYCKCQYQSGCRLFKYCKGDLCNYIDFTPIPCESYSSILFCHQVQGAGCLCGAGPNQLTENGNGVDITSFSPEIESLFKQQKGMNSFVGPNPVMDKLNTIVLLNQDSHVKFSLFDTFGQQLMEESFALELGQNELIFNFDQLAKPGLYFLIIQDSQGNSEVHKIIHMK